MFLHWQDRRFSPEPFYHCWKSPTLGKLKANWLSGNWDGFVSLTLCRWCTLPREASGAPPPYPALPPAPSDLPPQLGEPLRRHCSAEPTVLASLSTHTFRHARLTFLPNAQKDCSPTRALQDCPACRMEEESLTSSTFYGLLQEKAASE